MHLRYLTLIGLLFGCAQQGNYVSGPTTPILNEPQMRHYSRRASAPEEIRAALATCSEERKIGRHSAVWAVDCFAGKLPDISRRSRVPMTADDDLRLAKMRELAEKVDQHKLTDIEAQFKYAEYDAAIRRRDAREIEQKEAFAEDQQATEAAIGALEAQAEASQRAQAQADILSAAAFFGAMSAPSRLPAGAYMLPSQLPSQSPTTICQTLANTTYCY